MTAAIPTIVTNVADTVLVLDEAFAVSTVLSAALGTGGRERDKEGIQIERGKQEYKKLFLVKREKKRQKMLQVGPKENDHTREKNGKDFAKRSMDEKYSAGNFMENYFMAAIYRQ